MVKDVLDALKSLVDVADSAGDHANINMMDDAIAQARAVIAKVEASVQPFAGYQVMVNGRETAIIHLDRDELIRQLAFLIDRVEAIDLLSERLSSEIRGIRTGQVPTITN